MKYCKCSFNYYICIKINKMRTASFLIENELGEFVCVSRKDNHDIFGLPGGKSEGEESILETAKRETSEETGIIIPEEFKGNPVYFRECDGYMSYTFHIKVTKDEITFNHNEPHVVKWGTREDLENGPFGDYNKQLFDNLK